MKAQIIAEISEFILPVINSINEKQHNAKL